MWHMGDGWGWWMLMGWVWMLVFWGLVIYGIYAITARWRRDETHDVPPEPSALEVLERRYARGELTDEQFESMRERLTGGREEKAAVNGAAAPPPSRR